MVGVQVTQVRTDSAAEWLRPLILTVGTDANLWFTEYNGNRIGKISTDGVILDEYDIPTPNSGPIGITTGPEGNIWFTEDTTNKVGRLRAPANHFLVTAAATGVSGTAFDITVTAMGPLGNIVSTQGACRAILNRSTSDSGPRSHQG
jgi:virginiamycin B lyase